MSDQWIQGIDLSKHQGNVDMKLVAQEAHMAFVIVKCTEGADYLDPKFAQFWKTLVAMTPGGGGSAQIVRGAYHFGRPDNRPGRAGGETEGRWFAKTLQAAGHYDRGALPPVLDWEKWTAIDKDTRKANLEWIRGWLDVVEQELGRPAMIYTGVNVWSATTGNSDDFVDRPLWNVKYRAGGREPPRIPKSAGKKPWPWTLWQWSGGGSHNHYGKVTGVPGGVADVNRFNGDIDALMKLANAERVPHCVATGHPIA